MSLHSIGPYAFLCLILCILGCGGGGDSSDPYGREDAPPPTADSPGGGGGSTGGSVSKFDSAKANEYIRSTAEYLNGMSNEYESLAGSGEQQVELKRTEQLYQLMSPLSQKALALPSPDVSEAQKLKSSSLESLLEAIKRAQIAELHFARKYDTSGFGFMSFGANRGHEISHGISIAKKFLIHFQKNLPVAEKLTTGAPPTIGGPPATNRSFGYLHSVKLDPAEYRSVHDRTGSAEMIPWRLRVDEPVQPYEIDEATVVEIDAPSAEVAGTPFYTPMKVLHPLMPSLHVGLGLNELPSHNRQIWSLEPKQRRGIVKKIQLQKSQLMALSADGLLFAARPENTSIIGLFDVKKGTAIGQIDKEFAPGETGSLFFAADNRLVYYDRSELSVWTTPDLKLERTIEIPTSPISRSWNPGHPFAISPGGRYFAAPGNQNFQNDIRFYDLTTGETAAQISLSGIGTIRFIATSFSLDGKKLAVLLEGPWNTWIQVWEVASGQLLASYTKDAQLSRAVDGDTKYQGPAVDWFPDGRRILLYGKGIFDTQTGQGTRLISSTVRYRVKPIGGDKIGVLQKKQFVAFDLNEIPANPTRWEAERIKTEVVAADNPFATVTEGDKPSALKMKRENSKLIEPVTEATWNVTPDPAEIAATPAVKIDGLPAENLHHAVITRNRMSAVLGYTDKPTRIWNGEVRDSDSMKSWVFACPLNGSGTKNRFDFSFPSGFMAASPTGEKVLTRDFDGFNRFDIWNTNEKKHIAGFIPYGQGRSDGGAPILWADFIDEDRVLTATAGQISCWNVSTHESLYEIPIQSLNSWPVFSPNGKYLAVLGKQSLSLINTESGKIEGYLPSLGLNGDLTSIAFNAQGDKIAINSSPNGGGEIAILGVDSGVVETTFPIPLSGSQLTWPQAGFLLVDGGYCVSIEKRAVAWIYQLNGVRVQSGPGEMQFYLSQEKYREPMTLQSQSLPTTETINALATKDPPNEIALSSGGTIAMDIQVLVPPGSSNFAADVKESLRSKFAENNITVDSAAKLKLVVRGSQGKTGGGISIGRIGPSFSDRSDIDEERVTWTLSIIQDNQTLWQRSISANNTGGVDLDEGVTGQAAINQANQQLNAKMWEKATSILLNFNVPKYVFGPESGKGLGSTQLGAK
ncbi:hypothetical protein [Thalassoglobus sp.]|uniref:WD40 repeat domain-containing protein n=1 Tax=Thalassoglobus sp. TaxID=2795869 RepID=UPI003AA8BF59